jgi:hypothetical protein
MNRKAILIESSKIKGHTELLGARVDIENWKNFLLSDLGGAWKASEIVCLSHPFSSDVERELRSDLTAYCFVAFSGHGADGTVALNDANMSCPISMLSPKGSRGAIIVDACRGVEEAVGYTATRKIAALNEAREGPVLNRALFGKATDFALANERSTDECLRYGFPPNPERRIFEAALDKSSAGLVKMLACATGQGAAEDPLAGGYYTSLLMQAAKKWNGNYGTESVYTTKRAHDYAAEKLPPQQTPEYSPAYLEFPFAVSA